MFAAFQFVLLLLVNDASIDAAKMSKQYGKRDSKLSALRCKRVTNDETGNELFALEKRVALIVSIAGTQ